MSYFDFGRKWSEKKFWGREARFKGSVAILEGKLSDFEVSLDRTCC